MVLLDCGIDGYGGVVMTMMLLGLLRKVLDIGNCKRCLWGAGGGGVVWKCGGGSWDGRIDDEGCCCGCEKKDIHSKSVFKTIIGKPNCIP